MDLITLALANSYTDDALSGAGALKGEKGDKGDKGDRGEDGKISQIQKKTIAATELNILEPNTMYIFNEVGNLNIEFNIQESNYRDEYIFSFVSGATPTVLTLPSSVQWVNELTVEANKRYEISIVDNIGLWCAVEVSG